VELPLGEICGVCLSGIERRATRTARIVAVLSTAAIAVYVTVRLPDDPTARLVSGMSVAIWYVLMYLIVKRVLREFLK